MASDLALDLGSSARLEPRFEDGRRRAPIGGRHAYDDLVAGGGPDPLDLRPADTDARGDQPKPVEVAAEPERSAVAQTPTRQELGPLAGVPVQVSAQPRLPFGEEGEDVSLRVRPATSTRRRNGHDDASIGMDHHTQPTGSGRATKGVVERATRQVKGGGDLGDGHNTMVTRRERIASPTRNSAGQFRPRARAGPSAPRFRRHPESPGGR